MKLKSTAITISLLLLGQFVQAQIRTEVNLPNLPNYKTLKADLHVHTVYSDGRVWPDIRIQEAWRDGLDVIALSDHINYKGPVVAKHMKFTDENAAYLDAEVYAKRLGITLIKGVELNAPTKGAGHFNFLFLDDANKVKPQKKDWIKSFEEAKKQGAFIQWNHPYLGQYGDPQWREFQEKVYSRGLLDGIEIFNGKFLHAASIAWAKERNLSVTASSDVHNLIDVTHFEYHRPITLIFAKENTIESLKEAMFAQRTAAYFADTIIGNEELLQPLFAASVEILPVNNVSYRNRLWIQLKNNTDIRFQLKLVSSDKGLRMPSSLVLIPNKINLGSVAVNQKEAIDGKVFKAKYRVENFKTLSGKAIEVELVLNAEKQKIEVMLPYLGDLQDDNEE